MNKNEAIIKLDQVAKQYRLGAIGGTTFKEEMQRVGAKLLHKEDPTVQIGETRDSSHEKFWALKNVSFEIKRGEAVGIIGHNGAGKSTLLKLLCRVTAPTEGTIAYNGRIVSMLEVGTGFHPELTGRENVYMNGAILGMSKKEIDSKMDEIIEFSECSQFIDTPVKRYSSGMYVKLAFSVAAHLDADIMIMDEVLAVGDMKFQQKCLKKMREATVKEGKTVLYVSHNMATIMQLCSRCIVLKRGEVVYDGDVESGINLYLNSGEDTLAKKIYTTYVRPKWLVLNDVRLQEVSFYKRNNNVFVDSESMYVKYKWINNKEVENLCLRLEIRTQEGVPVGTAFLENFYSGRIGENGEIVVKYSMQNLAEGKYSSYITLYYRGDHGNNIDVDCVNGLSFVKKILREDSIKWNSRNWGSIRLADGEVVSPCQNMSDIFVL